MTLQDFAQRGRTFTVEVVDASGDRAMVEGRALLGEDARRARELLQSDDASGAMIVLQLICPELEGMEPEDVEHVVNRCGGLAGGFGELFRKGLGQHRPASREVDADDGPF